MYPLVNVLRFTLAIFSGLAALALTGCASITGSSQQSLSVETRDSAASVTGVTCELSNDKGKWFLNTPGSAYVQKSSENLNVLCKKDGLSPGQASVASTTKAGMVGLTKSLAVDEAKHGVTANAVAPGWIKTASQSISEGSEGGSTPMGRSATPEEVAAIVAALSIVTSRQSARSHVNATSPWGTPILRTPLNGAWGAPQFR